MNHGIFLRSLGVDLESLKVSHIKRLQVSDARGNFFEQQLPLGGFGISRYKLDHQLAILAKENHVTVYTSKPVSTKFHFINDEFILEPQTEILKQNLRPAVLANEAILISNGNDLYAIAKNNKLNNYIGIKYHVRYNFPNDLIALHNFKNGYCGISKVEDDQILLMLFHHCRIICKIVEMIYKRMEKRSFPPIHI